MPRPLSNDLRERVVKAVESGMSRNAAAEKFEVSISAAVKLLQKWHATGSYLPYRVGGHRKHLLVEHTEKVEQLLADKPDITVAEMQKKLAASRIKVSQSAITRFLKHLGHSYKKNGTRQRAKQT